MSFLINTNVNAMGVLNNLQATSMMQNTSIQRLSSGLRINSAADDPSGLIISQKFKAQITGLNQAISNAQDGINYTKTADGALSEVSSLLNTARGLAVAASNSATLSSSQQQADNLQLKSIVSSINNIASTTQYGTKYLLNGSAGTSSAVTNAADISSLNIGGTFGGAALSTSGSATLTVTTAATQAVTTLSQAFTTIGTAVTKAGSFTINGTTFNATTADTAGTLVQKINAATGQTNVTAAWDSTSGDIVLTQQTFGSAAQINVADANGVVDSAPGSPTGAAGVDAAATLTIGSTTVNFTGGLNGSDGLTLSDKDGNSVGLTVGGNSTTVSAATVGQIEANAGTFQIGANAGQTASFSLGNFSASNLGTTAVSGQNLSTIDLLSGANAQTALKVIDSAIDQVSTARGNIGSFQANTLQTTISTLTTASTNLSAANSSISDTNMAQEMTNYTKQSIIMQAGESMLGQANSQPQAVLKLLQSI
jgi:flagellin